MAMLETQTGSEINAANRPFFVAEKDQEKLSEVIFFESQRFWITHHDLLIDSPSTLLQFGIDESNHEIDLDRPNPENPRNKGLGIVTLIFDPSERDSRKYKWYLIKADNLGRQEYTISSSEFNISSQCDTYDGQGKLTKQEEANPIKIFNEIRYITKLPLMVERIDELRKRKERAEISLSLLAIDGLLRYSPALHEKKLNRLQDRVDKTVFPEFINPIISEIPEWDEQTKSEFLKKMKMLRGQLEAERQ